MRVLLIAPSYFSVYKQFAKAARIGANYPPTGLLFLAGALLADGHEVEIMDVDAERISAEEVCERVRRFAPELVGLTATTPTFRNAAAMAKDILAVHPVPMVVGGIHVTVLGEEALRDESVFDFAVLGEGEVTFRELVSTLAEKGDPAKVRGILYRRQGIMMRTPPRELASNLDSLPNPAWHLIKAENYQWIPPGKPTTPLASILTQRGCPYQCSFCSQDQMFTRKVRYRSVPHVLAELDYLVRTLGYQHIIFLDDTLVIKRQRMVDICEGIQRLGLKFTWEGMARANLVDAPLLKLMAEAGLSRLSYGVESGDQKILEDIDKGVTLEQIRQGYRWAKEAGIETRGSAIIGHPGETRASAWRTIRFLRGLKDLDQAYLNIMVPYPGTKVWQLAKNGQAGYRLLSEDYHNYVRYATPVLEVNDLDAGALVRLQKIGLWYFYLTPHRVLHNLFRSGLKNGLRMAWAFFRSAFARTEET